LIQILGLRVILRYLWGVTKRLNRLVNADSFDQFGRITLELGWAGSDQIDAAMTASREMGLPLGLVLCNRGQITKNELRSLIQAQSAVRDEELNPVIAIMALTIVGWSGVTLETALMFLGSTLRGASVDSNKLGDLLVAATCISSEGLAAALRFVSATGLPLGLTLVFRQLITRNCLQMALEVQSLLRVDKINREDAIDSMRLSHSKVCPPDAGKNTIELPRKPRLGELLVLAEVISRDDIQMALEVATNNRRRLGDVLTVFSLVKPGSLSAALELQRMLSNGEISLDEAISALSQAHQKGIPIRAAIDSNRGARAAQESKLSLAGFLETVGVLSSRDLKTLRLKALDNSAVLAKLIPPDSVVDEYIMQNAARLKYLVNAQVLTLDSACFVFHHCAQQRLDVDDFLRVSGWYAPVEPGSNVFASHCGNLVVV
jgi:hypothetical protein